MTENPPSPDLPPPESNEPAPPPRRSIFPPPAPPPDQTTGIGQVVARVLLGIITFLLSIGVFTVLVAATQHIVAGFVIAVAAVAGLFLARKRSGPSPLLGAVVVGASVALVVFGGCLLLVYSMK